MGLNIGDAFKNLGNQIKSSVQHTNAAVASSVQHTNAAVAASVQHTNASVAKSNATILQVLSTPPPKPKVDMAALQKATQIIVGIAELTPIGRELAKAAILIADKTDHGTASAYLGMGNTNSTFDMVPGGFLAQTIANDATNGKSGQALTTLVPDPKKMAMEDLKTVAKAAVTNPKSTLFVAKEVGKQNIAALKSAPVTRAVAPVAHTLSVAAIRAAPIAVTPAKQSIA